MNKDKQLQQLIIANKQINKQINKAKISQWGNKQMKKKQQITIHKNLQSGKIHQTQQRTTNHFTSSNRALLQKNSDKQSRTQKQSRKVVSQQKIISTKRLQSKNSSKQSRQMSSSIGKNEKVKKKKSQSVKGSKKSLKYQNSQEQNSIVSGQIKNIYTNKQKSKKKKANFTDRSSTQGPIQQPSLTSITQSIKSQGNRLDVDQLVQQIQQHQFGNLHKLKLHVLNFIFKNRVIRDQQYDRLYELMVEKFPDREDICRSVLFEIVSSLDN